MKSIVILLNCMRFFSVVVVGLCTFSFLTFQFFGPWFLYLSQVSDHSIVIQLERSKRYVSLFFIAIYQNFHAVRCNATFQ